MNQLKLLMVGAIVLGASIGTSRNAQSQEVSAKPAPPAQDDSSVASIRASSAKIESAFNAGKVDDLASMFLANGELIDEQGTIYQSEQEIKEILNALFEKFPGIQVSLNTESIRAIGPTAIEEGTRTMSAKDGASQAQLRYLTIWVKTDGGWKIASHRDVVDDSIADSQRVSRSRSLGSRETGSMKVRTERSPFHFAGPKTRTFCLANSTWILQSRIRSQVFPTDRLGCTSREYSLVAFRFRRWFFRGHLGDSR